MRTKGLAVGLVVLLGATGPVWADVFNMGDPNLRNLEFVPVADPNNAGELSGAGAGGYGPDHICGAVDHTYQMGKFEVTNAQYAVFLNAVGKSGQHVPYNDMYDDRMGSGRGGITRAGSEGNYVYETIPGRANKPAIFVTWWNAWRFANWLHNGQPTGDPGPSTTEDGAYDLSLAGTGERKPGARVFLPSEDEWYKAAYYDPNKPGGPGYWDYATASDMAPSPEAPPGTDPNGSACYRFGVALLDFTDVGAYTYKPSASAYGTFDQSGNAWEWNDTRFSEVPPGAARGVRGGSLSDGNECLQASFRYYDNYPAGPSGEFGFRVAQVPEPATLCLLALGGLSLIRRRRRA